MDICTHPYLIGPDAQLGSLDQVVGQIINHLIAEPESNNGLNPCYRYRRVSEETIGQWRVMLEAAKPNQELLAKIPNAQQPLARILLERHKAIGLRVEAIRRIGNHRFTEAAETYLGNWRISRYEKIRATDILEREEPAPEEPKQFDATSIKHGITLALHREGLVGWSAKIVDGETAAISTHPSKKEIWVNSTARRSKKGLEKTVLHEFQHLKRTENGLQQPLPYSFGYGIHGDYILLEEGLATFVESINGLDTNRRRNAMFLLAVDAMRDGASYADISELALKYGFSETAAKDIAFRVKRGCADTSKPGGFPKDAAYFLGFLRVSELIHGSDSFPEADKLLQLGKISESDLRTATKLSRAKVLKPPKFQLIPNGHPSRI